MSAVNPTNFAESNALLAVMSSDEIEAQRILDGLFPGELSHLREAAQRLAEMCVATHRAKPRASRTFPSSLREGGADVAPPEPGAGSPSH